MNYLRFFSVNFLLLLHFQLMAMEQNNLGKRSQTCESFSKKSYSPSHVERKTPVTFAPSAEIVFVILGADHVPVQHVKLKEIKGKTSTVEFHNTMKLFNINFVVIIEPQQEIAGLIPKEVSSNIVVKANTREEYEKIIKDHQENRVAVVFHNNNKNAYYFMALDAQKRMLAFEQERKENEVVEEKTLKFKDFPNNISAAYYEKNICKTIVERTLNRILPPRYCGLSNMYLSGKKLARIVARCEQEYLHNTLVPITETSK